MKNKYSVLPFISDCKIWRYSFFYIILLCIIMLFFACLEKQVEGPGIAFKKKTYKFGKVNEGEKVNYTFKFKNIGTEILIIENVRPTCGCTLTGEYDKEVQPGASGEIPVELRTDGFQGEMSKIIRVLTNIPDKKDIVLTLQGTVHTPISVNPKVLWLGNITDTTVSLSNSFTVTNNTAKPLEILSVSPSHKNVTANIITIKKNKEFKIEITINPPYNTGRTEETLNIQTNNPDHEHITVRYSYNIPVGIIVYPQSITLEPGMTDTNLEKIINVENHFSEPISITNAYVTGTTLKYKIEELVKGKTFLIKLLFPAGFVLKEKDIFVFTFQTNKGRQTTVYNVTIKASKSSR